MMPSQVRNLKPRRMKRTKHPTRVVATPETDAAKMTAAANTAMQAPRYQ